MDPKDTREKYREALERDKKIQALEKRIRDGSGRYSDVDDIASRAGRHAGKLIAGTVKENAVDGMIEKDVAAAILQPTMYDNYEYVAGLAETVQKSLNKKAGIGLNTVKPRWNQSRVDGLAEELAEAEDVNELTDKLVSQVENASMSVVDEAVRENADFQYQVGMEPKIVREAEAKCCEWCANLEGEYDYKDVKDSGNDVYRRHDNCRCTVEFVPGNGTRQNVWSKKIQYDHEAANKRVRTVQKQVYEPASIDITNLRNETVHNSIGAKTRNYDIMDLVTGEIYHLAEGSVLQDKEVFAGKGSNKKYEKAWKYASRYGGRQEDWQHVKAKGVVSTSDGDRKAEIHWSQCENIGKREMFIKKWLD